MTKLVRLTSPSRRAFAQINQLLVQLSSSPRQLRYEQLKRLTADRNTHLMVLQDVERMTGMGTLVIVRLTTGVRARIEDVVIDKQYRGRGLGERLTKDLITIARRRGAAEVELSSRPGRVAANRLYQKLGFKRRETNVYTLLL